MNPRVLISTIDTHTAGGPTRIVTGGLPALNGETAAEKMAGFETNHDALRRLLVNEPRGHKDMYCAVTAPSSNARADLAVFFMTAQGYLRTCVHSSIGAATALLETGRLRPRADAYVYFETPGGVISLHPIYVGARLTSIQLKMGTGFVHAPDLELESTGQTVHAAAVYCGVFFLLVDASQFGRGATLEHLSFFVDAGKNLLETANSQLKVRHPEIVSADKFSLALFYDSVEPDEYRDVVIGPTGSIDRSPCGAGTGALTIYEHAQGRISLGDTVTVKGVIGTSFRARVVQVERVGPYSGAIPQVEGSAFITGYHEFRLDERDPLTEGFVLRG